MVKMLIIDDEKGVGELLTKLFEPDGYEVKSAQDPLEGLKLVEEFKPDCLFLDIKMPRMEGVDVLARVKEINKDIAVIMITGYGNIETAMESMKLGAFDYITKPFDIAFIKMLVKRALEGIK